MAGDSSDVNTPVTRATTSPTSPPRDGAPRPWASWTTFAAMILLATALAPGIQAIGLVDMVDLVISSPNQKTGDSQPWRISFKTPSTGNMHNYVVSTTFPSGFIVPSNAGCTIDDMTTYAPTIVGQEVKCKINVGTRAANEYIVTRVSGLTNPTTEQLTGAFQVRFYDSSGILVTENAGVNANILANVFTSASAQAADGRAGETTTWTVSITPKNAVSALGDVRLVWPSGFDVQSDTACSIAGLSGPSANRVSSTEVICDLNTATLTAGQAYQLSLTKVKNPAMSKDPAATFLTAMTRDSTNALHDKVETIGLQVDPHPFTAADVTANSHTAGETVTFAFDVTMFNPWPAAACFDASFSDGTGLVQGQSVLSLEDGATGSFGPTTIDGRHARACRVDGSTASAGATITIELSNVQLPLNSENPVDVVGQTFNDLVNGNTVQGVIDQASDLWHDLVPPVCPPPCNPPPPKPPPPAGTPKAPVQLVAAAAQATQSIVLQWRAPSSDGGSPITNYRVYRAQVSSGPYAIAATIGNVTTYTDSGRGWATTWYYLVAAINTAGEGEQGSVSGAKTRDAPPMGSPSPQPTPTDLPRVDPLDNDGGQAELGDFSSPGAFLATMKDTKAWAYGGALVILGTGFTIMGLAWRRHNAKTHTRPPAKSPGKPPPK